MSAELPHPAAARYAAGVPAARRLRASVLLGVALVALLAAGCGRQAATPGGPPGRLKIRFATDWYPQPEHGGYYEALVRGYYAAAGLDVDLLPGNPNDTAERRVAMGEAEFGMSAADGMLIAQERGLPLIALTTTLQYDPQAIMVHPDSPVKTFADLSGHTVSVGPPGTPWFRYITLKYQLQNVRETPLTFTIANFIHDPNYIQQVFVTSEPYYARKQGADVRLLPIRDSGYNDYRVLMGNRDFVAKNPAVARGFVAASLHGWADYLQDPSAAHAEILKRNPEMKPDLMQYSWQALKDGHYIEGFADRGEAIGQMTAARWQHLYGILKQVGVLKTDFDPQSAYTLEFIPPP